MLIQVLKSKLKRVVITDANVEYAGSLTLDEDIMKAAWLNPNERVEVNSVYGKGRIVTYVIPGERGSGRVELNGGAANFFSVGEEIHVNCFGFVDEKDKPRNPRVVITNDINEITSIK